MLFAHRRPRRLCGEVKAFHEPIIPARRFACNSLIIRRESPLNNSLKFQNSGLPGGSLLFLGAGGKFSSERTRGTRLLAVTDGRRGARARTGTVRRSARDG